MSTLSRREFMALFGAASAGALLAACGSSSSSSTKGGSDSPLSLWWSFDDLTQQHYYQTHFIDAYNKTHPVPINLTVKSETTLAQNLETAFSAGAAPDMFWTGGVPFVQAYAEAGKLALLNDYSKQYDWASKLQPWALATSTQKDGKLYGVPSAYNSVVLFYNPATFKAHGWTPPKNREQFESICADAKSKGMLPIACGNADKALATGWYVSGIFNAFAGPKAMYDAITGKIPWTSPVFVDAVTLIQSWVKKGWFGGGAQLYATLKFNDMYAEIANGKAAMMIDLSLAFSELPLYIGKAAGNSETYAWEPLPPLAPGVPSDVYVLAVGGSISINKDCKDPEKGAEYINWLLDPKRQMDALAASGIGPYPIKTTLEDFPATLDPNVKSFYGALGTARNVGYGSWSAFPPASAAYMWTGMNEVIAGSTSPSEFCSQLDSTFKTALSKGQVAPVAPPNSVTRS